MAAEIYSDDESQGSHVDPAEVEDIDDLDADLFSSSRRLRLHTVALVSPKKSALKGFGDNSEKHSKSRVSFDSPNKVAPARMTSKMSLGLDEADPLADLLSDEDSAGSKTEDKKSFQSSIKPGSLGISQRIATGDSPNTSATKADKSKVISDLFGLGSDDSENKPPAAQVPAHKDERKNDPLSGGHSSDWLGIKSPIKTRSAIVDEAEVSQSKAKQPASSKKMGLDTKKENDDDLLERMGFSDRKVSKPLDPSGGKVVSASSKSKSIMADLFGGNVLGTGKEKGVSILNSPVKTVENKDVAQVLNPVSFGSYAPSVSSAREPRRSAPRHASSVADPLGLFSSSPKAAAQEDSTNVLAEKSGPATPRTSDHLGVESNPRPLAGVSGSSGEAVVAAPPLLGNPTPGGANLPEWLGGGSESLQKYEPTTTGRAMQEAIPLEAALPQLPQLPQLDDSRVLGLSLLDQEMAASLQRQEAQLVAALQTRQRQEQLADLHRRQHQLLACHEAQLQQLVEHQAERQRQLEGLLARQQDRIAAHVQALLSQPLVVPASQLPEVGITAEAPVHFPQPMHDGIDCTQAKASCDVAAGSDAEARHREEVERLEGFYKRHIDLLESSLERLEARLRAENVRLEEEYQARITKLQEEQRSLEDAHKQKVAALQQEKLADMQHLKELYQREVDDLREHYARVVAAEQDSSVQTRSLQLLSEQLGQSSAQLVALQARLDAGQHSELDVRDATLCAREAELKAMREALERQRLASEEERKRLVDLVADLELRAAERQAEVDARAWELRQEAAKLEARTRALEGERQRGLAQLEHDRRQLQQLKQSALDEQKQVTQQLREEQLRLSAEKARLEAVSRLQGAPAIVAVTDIEEVRAEAGAAMQVALDSARQADAVRQKLAEQERQLAGEQRRLRNKERELTVRSQELSVLEEMAATTKEEGVRALEECRALQQQHAARAAELQQQLAQLKERERRLAEEKVVLSQERLALQKSSELDRFCSFCRTLLEHSGPAVPSSTKPSQKHFVDPEQVIIRLSGERDGDYSHSNFPSLISK